MAYIIPQLAGKVPLKKNTYNMAYLMAPYLIGILISWLWGDSHQPNALVGAVISKCR